MLLSRFGALAVEKNVERSDDRRQSFFCIEYETENPYPETKPSRS